MQAYTYNYITGEREQLKAGAILFVLDNGREIEVRLSGLRDKSSLEMSTPDDGVLCIKPTTPSSVRVQVASAGAAATAYHLGEDAFVEPSDARPGNIHDDRVQVDAADEKFKVPPPPPRKGPPRPPGW